MPLVQLLSLTLCDLLTIMYNYAMTIAIVITVTMTVRVTL